MMDIQPDDFLVALLKSPAIAVVVADHEDQISIVNPAASELFGWPVDVTQWATTFTELFPNRLHADDAQFIESLERIGTLELAAKHCEGKEIWVEATITSFESNGVRWRLGVFRDLRLQQERESQLHQAAIIDSLSGLLNRGEFQRVLEASAGQPLALAIIDIDHFKSINDCFGHPVGDQMIQRTGSILTAIFENAIAVSRLGGDEFGVLMKLRSVDDLFESKFNNFQGELVAAAHDREGLELTCSVGLARDRSGFATPRELLSKADQAMYESKRGGRNRMTVVTLGK